MITPKQISDSLEVPPSTLRRWANRFDNHLSPHEPGKHRSYTPTDFDTFRKIQNLLDQNLTYDEIESKLDLVETPPDKSNSLLLLKDYTQIIEEARANVQILRSQMDNQDKRIKQLEAWISLPWYRKIFTKPPEA